MESAVGLLEVQGYSVALAAMDKACKAADITIMGIECNNPKMGNKAPIPLVIQVKFTGKIDDVKIALETARDEAGKYIRPEDILTRLIPSSAKGMEKLLQIGKVKLKS